jgi:pimeloyl-ACP methyl ester carboxylesterase
MQTPDLVVLVPGFLGFDRLGGFYYFADRVIAALRGFLEEPLGYGVPVVPVTTLPTDSLAKRQATLIESLRTLCEKKLSGVERIHLVGHSTGGVDVQLLACTEALEGRAWDRRANEIRRRIRSVVTISAPHHGTSLADSWLADWAENPILGRAPMVPEVIKLGYHLIGLVPQEAPLLARLQLAHPRAIVKFFAQVALHRELIEDLRPAHMEKLRATLTPERGVALTCFVTGTELRRTGDRPSDAFFRDMYGLTEGDGKVSAAVEECRALLKDLVARRPDWMIRSNRSLRPFVDARLNDGVVNTVRQIVHCDRPDEVGGFVVADHADVLGHYDRQDSLIEGTSYNEGLFHSGAGFGDDEFFRLYRRVAAAILKTISSTRRARQRGAAVIVDVRSIWDGLDVESARIADLELTFLDCEPPRSEDAQEELLSELSHEAQRIADARFEQGRVRAECVRVVPGSFVVSLVLMATIGSKFFKDYPALREGALRFAEDLRDAAETLTDIVARHARPRPTDAETAVGAAAPPAE